jgi:hypothetical protein
MTASPLEEARRLLQGAGTWHEFKTSLDERRLDLALGPMDMDLCAVNGRPCRPSGWTIRF